MKATTGPTTHRHKVGTCPACRDYLWAEVDVIVTISEPTIDVEGKPHVFVTPRCVAMRLSHECAKGEDDE